MRHARRVNLNPPHPPRTTWNDRSHPCAACGSRSATPQLSSGAPRKNHPTHLPSNKRFNLGMNTRSPSFFPKILPPPLQASQIMWKKISLPAIIPAPLRPRQTRPAPCQTSKSQMLPVGIAHNYKAAAWLSSLVWSWESCGSNLTQLLIWYFFCIGVWCVAGAGATMTCLVYSEDRA